MTEEEKKLAYEAFIKEAGTTTDLRNKVLRPGAIDRSKLNKDVDALLEPLWEMIKGKPSTFPPSSHKASHEKGGNDEINHDNLIGFVATEHKDLPNTIAEVLTDHDKVTHDALGIDHGSLSGLSDNDHNLYGTKTTADWNKSIGAGGDYTTWAAMIADMPNLIAHEVTITIKKGTTLDETCNLQNKHGLTNGAKITIQAEEYFPQSGAIPTATSATATTLVDTAQDWAIDRFIDCWVFIVHGVGTDNGFVKITDSDATSITVASWPGTQPDNTSRYLILGALIDGAVRTRNCMDLKNSLCPIYLYGLGFYEGYFSTQTVGCQWTRQEYCGHYKARYGAVVVESIKANFRKCGIVNNHIEASTNYAGIRIEASNYGYIQDSAFSDNSVQGIMIIQGAFAYIANNFGDGNGTWGTYAKYSGQAHMYGTECSGSSGDHSNGTGDGSLAYT